MSSIKIRLKNIRGTTRVRTLIAHPMETGRRINKITGERIPLHFIEKLTVYHNDNVIATCYLAPGISKDPYFSFSFRGGETGDTVTINWEDNLGYKDMAKATLK